MFNAFHVTPLGHTNLERYHYKITRAGQARLIGLKPGKHTKREFLALATEEEWQRLYPKSTAASRNRHGHMTWDLSADKLAEHLMQQCREQGAFDQRCVRAQGIWRDGQRLVVNTGAMLYTADDGASHTLAGFKSAEGYHYIAPLDASPLLPVPAGEEATADEGRQLLALLERWEWEESEQCSTAFSSKLVAGWIVCAFIPGLLQWRPHLYITGSKGSGKSTLVDLCRNIIGPALVHYVQVGTTEAGLRQSLAHQARPVIFDEFEAHNDATPRVLELIRASCSNDAPAIIKGSAEGAAQAFYPQLIALCAGIHVKFNNAADASRFAVLHLGLVQHSASERTEFAVLRNAVIGNGPKFMRRILRRFYEFEASLEVLKSVLAEAGFDDRQVDVYAPLLAGYWMLTHDTVAVTGDAEPLVRELRHPDEEETDEWECLNHLLGWVIDTGTGNRPTVAEHLHKAASPGGGEEASFLARYGIKVAMHKGRQWVLVANTHSGTLRIFKDTRWAGGRAHKDALRRLGGVPLESAVRFGAVTHKVTALPWELVFPPADDEPGQTAQDVTPA